MSDSPAEDRFTAEAHRLAEVLAECVRSRHVSIRSLEQKMGVAESLFHKVLNGKITLQVRHVLMIAEAAGIGWREFFARAYGLEEGAAALGEAREAGKRTAEEEIESRIEEALERRLPELLLRLGVIDAETARKAALPSPEQ